MKSMKKIQILGAGWQNSGDEAIFAVIDVVIQEGILVHGY